MPKNNISISVPSLRSRMNACGAAGTPFLFAVDYERTEAYFIEDPLAQHDLFFRIGPTGNKPAGIPSTSAGTLTVDPIAPEEYRARFEVVAEALRRGETVLTNLTVRTPIHTGLTLEAIFQAADARYQFYVPGRFVCFSPECFVRMTDGRISTYPMKGTIDASLPDAEQRLLDDPKEAAEHRAAVDLLADDLRRIAKNVRVERFRYIDRIPTSEREILQTSSELVGELPDDWRAHLGDMIVELLPAGSIAGAPKASTLDVIRRAEPEPRGFYTGVFGWFDGTSLDSGVLIRFIEEHDGRQYYRSGGGVTAASDWRKEYREVSDKIYLPR